MKFPLFDFEGALAEKAGTFDKDGAGRPKASLQGYGPKAWRAGSAKRTPSGIQRAGEAL